MRRRILLAGATGAIGRRLTRLLRDADLVVFGTTRSPAKAQELRALGIEPLVVDVFDAQALTDAVARARPDVVIHQLTELPAALPPDQMAAAAPRNARIRDEDTGNLVRAALAAGAKRFVAQSIAWAYAPGPLPHVEDDPLDVGATGGRAVSVGGVVALENYVLRTPGLDGVVLRYGQLYGPGTGFDAPNGSIPLHVDAAADAAFLALGKGSPGAFNIAERNGDASTRKAVSELGWRAEFRLEDVLGSVSCVDGPCGASGKLTLHGRVAVMCPVC